MRQWRYRDETGRVCTKCETYKIWSEFNQSRPECRQCQKALAKRYKRDTDKAAAASRRWYAKHKKGSKDVRTKEEGSTD